MKPLTATLILSACIVGVFILFSPRCLADPQVGKPKTAIIVPLYFDSTNEIEVVSTTNLAKGSWSVITNFNPTHTREDLLITNPKDVEFLSIRYTAYKKLMPDPPVAKISTNAVKEVSSVPPIPSH